MVAPIVFYGLCGIGGYIGSRAVSNMRTVDSNNERAMKKNARAFNKMADAQTELLETQNAVQESLLRLANRKKGIINTSIKKFLDIYTLLQEVRFVQKKDIYELITAPVMNETVKVLNQSISVAGMKGSSSEIVHCLLCLSITKSIVYDSERALSVARMRERQADVIASQAETNVIALKAIGDKADRIADLLTKLNQLFYRSINVIDKIITEKKNNMDLYNDHDYECIMTCLNMADAIKKIIDAPIFNDCGEITEQARRALDIGEKYVENLKKI